MAISAQVATKTDIAEVKVEMAELCGELRAAIGAVEEKLGGDVKVLRWMGGTIVVVQLGILAKLLFP